MNFLKLTEKETREDIFINFDKIICFRSLHDWTYIIYDNVQSNVIETPEEIYELIESGCSNLKELKNYKECKENSQRIFEKASMEVLPESVAHTLKIIGLKEDE